MSVNIRNKTNIYNNFWCSSSVVVPERPEEPFLFPVTISAEGGVAPYTVAINQYIKFITSANSNSVSNSEGSTGTITWEDDNTMILESFPTTNNYHPYFNFIDEPAIVGEEVHITFDYENIGDELWDLSISMGAWEPNYNAFSPRVDVAPGESGTYEATTIVIGSHDTIVFRNADLINGLMKISNIEVHYIDRTGTTDYQLPHIELEEFGSHDYVVTDSVGSTCSTSIEIDVPDVDDSLQFLVMPQKNYDGSELKLKVYCNALWGNVYINWGDGSLIESYSTTDYIYPTHDYTPDVNGLQNVDIYGEGINNWYFYQYNRAVVTADYLNKFTDDRLRNFYIYRGLFISPIDKLENDYALWYQYYGTTFGGDIAVFKDTHYIILFTPYTYTEDSANYAPGIYGDVGTFLKGNFDTTYNAWYKRVYSYGNNHIYQDRIDAPIKINTNVAIKGFTTTDAYWSLRDPNEVAQLIIDLDTWREPGTFTLDLRNNASPNNADEPLLSEFIIAKANLIADGIVVSHS